jgi:mono/diheme cytochrome c family protein
MALRRRRLGGFDPGARGERAMKKKTCIIALSMMALAIGGGIPLLGASSPEDDSSTDQVKGYWVLSGDAEKGAKIFATSCAACHGPEGDGKGEVRLKDVEIPNFQDRSTATKETYYEWYQVIRDGGGDHGLCTKMLPAGHRMDDQSIHDLVAFLRTLPAQAYVERARSGS